MQSKLVRTGAILSLMCALAILAPKSRASECRPYNNSRPAIVWAVPVCAFTGPGCVECISEDSGGNRESCVYGDSGREICINHQGWTPIE